MTSNPCRQGACGNCRGEDPNEPNWIRCDHSCHLWCLAVPKPDGGEAYIPTRSLRHAEGMAKRWKGDVRVTLWPGDQELHAAMTRGLDRLFGVRGPRSAVNDA